MRVALVFSLILAVLTVVFALQNDDPMTVDFLFIETQGSTALVLIVTFAVGVITGLLSTLPGRIRDKRKLRKLKGSSSTPAPGPSAFESPSAEAHSRKRSKPSSTSDTTSSRSGSATEKADSSPS